MNFRIHFIILSLFILLAAGCNGEKPQQESTVKQDTTNLSETEILDQKIKAEPENADLYHQRAKLHMEKANINGALSDINTAIEKGGRKPDYIITLSDIYFAMGQVTKTEQALQSVLIEDNNHMDALLKMAQLHLYHGNHNQAFGFLNRALNIAPEDERIYFLSGMINKDKGEIDKAIRDFHRATEADQEFYEAWIQLGVIAAEDQDSMAVLYYENALDAEPESQEAIYNLGYFYQQQEKYQRAIDTYNRLLDINPQNINAYYNLGFIYLTVLEEYQKAEENFRRVLDLDPDNVNAVYNLGHALELQEKYEEARKHYQQTLEMQENYRLGIEGLNRLDRKTR